jgi:hypothetical protein
MGPKMFNPTPLHPSDYEKKRTADQSANLGRVLNIQFGNRVIIWGHIKFPHLSFENLPAFPFPGMGSKMFNRQMPYDSKINNRQESGDERIDTDIDQIILTRIWLVHRLLKSVKEVESTLDWDC